MANTEIGFEEIEREVLEGADIKEQNILTALRGKDPDAYRDAVFDYYAQQMFRGKIDRVLRRPMGKGGKKPGSHGERRHK